MDNYAYQTGPSGSKTNGLSSANIREINMLDSLYKKIQDFLLVMATGCCEEIDQEVTLSAEAVARILKLIMNRISFFVPTPDVRQKHISRKQEIQESLVAIAGARKHLGIKLDSKVRLDEEINYTQLCKNTNRANIQSLVASDEVAVVFDEIMLISEKIIACIKDYFTENGDISYQYAAIGTAEIALIVDKIRWHLRRIISVNQIPEYSNSPLYSDIINTLEGNPLCQSVLLYARRQAEAFLNTFEENLSSRSVQVIGDGTQIRTYSDN